MEIFNEEKFKNLKNKLLNFTIKLNNNVSFQNEINTQLISFNEFLINFYLDNELLHENAIDDDYYIITGNYIIEEFNIIEFENFENFLNKYHNAFESIIAECITLINN